MSERAERCALCGAELDDDVEVESDGPVCSECRDARTDDALDEADEAEGTSPYEQAYDRPVQIAIWSVALIAAGMLVILFRYRGVIPTEVSIICLVVSLAIGFGAVWAAS